MGKVDLLKQTQCLFLFPFFHAGCATIKTVFPISTPTSLLALVPVEVSKVVQREALAVETGISYDEAIRRVLVMEASGKLNARLE